MKRLLAVALLAALPFTLHAKEKNPLAKYAGTYKGETRAKGETRDQSREGTYAIRHHTISLDLGKDGTATLTQSPTGENELTTFAHWTVEGDILKLTFDPIDKQPTPAPMTFRFAKKMLTPVVYDHTLWPKLPPPPLTFQRPHELGNDD
jgi:hypothetical protein